MVAGYGELMQQKVLTSLRHISPITHNN